MKKTFNLELFSCGLYSSFCYHVPSRTLFDCGEGATLHFRNYIYGVERIFISHSHIDHVNGLLSFIGIRNSARGDKEKPLTIYYPSDNTSILAVKAAISTLYNRLSYPIYWVGIDAGFERKIDEFQTLVAFSMEHQKSKQTLGYKIVERRTRLKAEFQGKNIPELIKNGVDKLALNEQYSAITFAYCLDNYRFDIKNVEDATVAILDSTFLDRKDRDDPTHATLDECLEVVKNARVKNAIFAHVSPRYREDDLAKAREKIDQENQYLTSNTKVCYL